MNDRAAEIRAYVLDQVRERLDAAGLDRADIRDDTDLLADGVLDSLEVLELMAVVADRYGIEGDWEDYDPEQILVIGPFCHYVEQNMSVGSGESS